MSKKSKIIIAVIVLIVAAVCTYYFWYKPKYGKKTSATGSDTLGTTGPVKGVVPIPRTATQSPIVPVAMS